MTLNQGIFLILIFCVLPIFLILGTWTGLVAAAHADKAMERRCLEIIEHNARGDIRLNERSNNDD